MKRSAVKQIFKSLLDFRFTLSDQFFHQTIGAGIGPVRTDSLLINKINDRPRIVDILSFSKRESVIPVLYLLLLIKQTVFL